MGNQKLAQEIRGEHPLRRERPNGHAAQSLGEVSRPGWRFHPPRQNLLARISGDYYDGVEGEELPLADDFELRRRNRNPLNVLLVVNPKVNVCNVSGYYEMAEIGRDSADRSCGISHIFHG